MSSASPASSQRSEGQQSDERAAYYAVLDARFGPYGDIFRCEGNDYRALKRVVAYLLPPGAYLTWEAIFIFHMYRQVPFPTIKRLAWMRAVTPRAIQLNIQYMEELGLLRRRPTIFRGRVVLEYHFDGLYALAYDYLLYERSDQFMDWRELTPLHAPLIPKELTRFLIYDKIVRDRPRGRKRSGRFASSWPGSAFADLPGYADADPDPIPEGDPEMQGPLLFPDEPFRDDDLPGGEDDRYPAYDDASPVYNAEDISSCATAPYTLQSTATPVQAAVAPAGELAQLTLIGLDEPIAEPPVTPASVVQSIAEPAEQPTISSTQPIESAVMPAVPADAEQADEQEVVEGEVIEVAEAADVQASEGLRAEQKIFPRRPSLQEQRSGKTAWKRDKLLPTSAALALHKVSQLFNDDYPRASHAQAVKLYAEILALNSVKDAYAISSPEHYFTSLIESFCARLQNQEFISVNWQGRPNGMPLFFTVLRQQVEMLVENITEQRKADALLRFQAERARYVPGQDRGGAGRTYAYDCGEAAAGRTLEAAAGRTLEEGNVVDGDVQEVTYVEGQIVEADPSPGSDPGPLHPDLPPCPNVRFSRREMSCWELEDFFCLLTAEELVALGQHYDYIHTEDEVQTILTDADEGKLAYYVGVSIRVAIYYEVYDYFKTA